MLVMTLSGVPDVRFNFELLDPQENRLDYSWFGETGQGEEIMKMKFPAGTYYLKIKVRGGKNTGAEEMYQHAIATLGVIEALADLNDESLEPMAREAIELILRSQNSEHKPETLGGPVKPESPYYGGWRYSPDSTDSDISLTGRQILGLKAAANVRFVIPNYVFPAAARFVRSLFGKEDESFCYDLPGERGDSCARAGMGTLSLQLSGYPKDSMIPPAIRFMQNHPPRWNVEEPGNGYPFYYWYYGTRVMYLADGDAAKLKEGAYALRVLIAPQPLETKITVKAGVRLTCLLKKEADGWKLTF